MDNLTQNSKETQNDDVYKILVDRVLAWHNNGSESPHLTRSN